MINNFEVDWEKTCKNISNRLAGKTRKKNFAELFGLTERGVQAKLSGKRLEINELYLIASFLRCTIEDLLVFRNDKFIEPETFDISTRDKAEIDSPQELDNSIAIFSQMANDREIRNLEEFFLYYPLMNEYALRDVAYRCHERWSSADRTYFGDKIDFLYTSIDDSPAKRYADAYRDNVLRVKGDGRREFNPDRYEEFYYYEKLKLFRNDINEDEFLNDILILLPKINIFDKNIIKAQKYL